MLRELFGIDQRRELRARLINIENKQDGNAHETRVRLINLEALLERAIKSLETRPRGNDVFADFPGSPDQGFGHLTYAQFGEDLMVANIFALLGIDKPTYLDVGANHPISGSNTALLYSRGSRGVIVEANPHLIPLWHESRPGDVALNVGVAPERGELTFHFIDDQSGRNTFNKEYADTFTKNHPQFQVQKTQTIKTVRLNDIVDEHLEGRWPDFLTLDIEGLDYPVLESAQFDGSSPMVICIETVDGAGVDASAPILDLLPRRGFVPVFRTWGNLIAVQERGAHTLGLRSAI